MNGHKDHRKWTFTYNWSRPLQGQCRTCRPTNSLQAINGTPSTDSYQGKPLTWFMVSLSSDWRLPWIHTWPTFKVIFSRYLSAIFLPLLLTSPSTWYICLVLAQNSHMVHMPYPTRQKYRSCINYRLEDPILHLFWGVMEGFFGYNFPKPKLYVVETWNISEGPWRTLIQEKWGKSPQGFCLRVPKRVFYIQCLSATYPRPKNS